MADEAQHRHYNDGHFVNPHDPFNPSLNRYPPQPQPYLSYAPQTPPPPPPLPGSNPFVTPFPSYSLETRPASSAASMHYRPSAPSMYEPHEEHELDDGDMPLLNHPSSQSKLSVPDRYDDGDDASSLGESENNVRYGRIPQRVPRRYKTLKRVEYVSSIIIISFRGNHP